MAQTAPIRLIVGLGNPGADYARTRHNAGFWFVDALALSAQAVWRRESKFGGDWTRVLLSPDHAECSLFKPQTYMNRSGQAVAAVASFYKLTPAQILVVHDELDLPPGVARLKQGGGHGGHNGLRDITAHIGADFLRLRLGIGHPGQRAEVIDYVLQRPNSADEALLGQAMDAARAVLPWILQGEIQKAMHALHTGGKE